MPKTRAIVGTSIALGVLLVGCVLLIWYLSTRIDKTQKHSVKPKYYASLPRHTSTLSVVDTTHAPPPSIASKEPLPDLQLHWAYRTGTYDIHLRAGGTPMTAAFDTGSSQLVVASNACATCKGPKYTTAASNLLMDPLSDNKQSCKTMITYVSQSNTIQMYKDILELTSTVTADCAGKVIGKTNTPLTITDFPIGGVTATTGKSAVNVLGMSSVLTTTLTNKKYVLPSCQLSDQQEYESAFVQAISMHNRARGMPNVWGIRFAAKRTDGATVSFGKPGGDCGYRMAYTPAIERIPAAGSDVVGTPWRFYVIEVARARTFKNNTPLPSFSRYLLVDTATTQFMIPNPTSATVLQNEGLVLTLANSTATELRWEGIEQDNDYETPLFTNMDDSVSVLFSKDRNVGIFGALGMRGMYVEFTLDPPRMVGFACCDRDSCTW